MGAAPGDLLTREGVRERYKVLVMGLHPDKVGGGAAATEAFGLLHSASRVLEGRLGNQGERAPKREPPLTPAPRLRMRPPQPPQTPTATAVRQVPPALRKWLRENVLGTKAGEAPHARARLTAFPVALDMVERACSGASGQGRKLALVTDASVQLPLTE